MRKAYTYTNAAGKRIHVKATCIVDTGMPGRGAKTLPKPNRGTLKAFGYSGVKNMTVKARHEALRKAVDAYTAQSVIAKLTLVRNYNKNTDPGSSRIFDRDAKWVSKQYLD